MCARRRRQITARGFFDLFMNIFNIGVLFFFVFVSGKNVIKMGCPFLLRKISLSLSLSLAFGSKTLLSHEDRNEKDPSSKV